MNGKIKQHLWKQKEYISILAECTVYSTNASSISMDLANGSVSMLHISMILESWRVIEKYIII